MVGKFGATREGVEVGCRLVEGGTPWEDYTCNKMCMCPHNMGAHGEQEERREQMVISL